jgi:hypothetical protein
MRRPTSPPRTTVLVLAAAAVLATVRSAETSAEPTPQQEPVQCWWRTSAGAVRLAEPFTLLLTCSIVESDRQHVVVDQAQLGAGALALSPFEVIGGGSLTEARSGNRFFFQRLYQVRIVTDQVGQDLQLPPVAVTYQLETESSAGGRVRGIERRHQLPPLLMRVVSLVPDEADDIREAAVDTFEQIDDASFAASLYSAAGLVLLGIGTLGLAVAVGTECRARRVKGIAPGTLEERLILRHLAGQFEEIRVMRAREGWTPALVARALAATRVVASYATRRPPSLRPLDGPDDVPAGGVVHRDNRGRRTLISSSLTAAALWGNDDAQRTGIRDALAALTRAHYGRAEPADAGLLDAGIDATLAALAALKREHAFIPRLRAAASRRLRATKIVRFR